MVRTWLDRTAALLPSRCAVCGGWPAEPVCAGCQGRFLRTQPRCTRCALPVPPGQPVCGACLRSPPVLDSCHAAVDYAYPWAELLARFKFAQEAGWSDFFAELMATRTGVRDVLRAVDAVVPMPLSPRRLAERGFNQSHELARRLAPDRLRTAWLLRLRDTRPQTTLARGERVANVRGAFAPDPRHALSIRGRRILLVDDVMTSGASLHAAAAALRSAGAEQVHAAVVARTPEPG